MNRYLWMAVTADKYELPLIVEESAAALAAKCGVTPGTVKSAAFRESDGRINGFKYVKVLKGE